MKRIWGLLACYCMLLSSLSLSAGELGIGDAAPKLEVDKFVKGQPVSEFKPGHVYVVEFWATWCGPCRATIPHLTKLQKEYGDKVTFIGVSVWERDVSLVEPFVKEMGEKMDYRVATDKVGKDEDASDGFMAKNWMTAAGQNGIPAAFIVNGEGKVAWIGHPGRIDKPLQEVVEGKYDVEAARKNFLAEKENEKKLDILRAKFAKARQEGPAAMIKVLDEAIQDTPTLETTLGMTKFNLLLQDKSNSDLAMKYGERLLNEVFKDDFTRLNELSWILVDPDKPDKANEAQADFAVKAARRAVELSMEKDHAVLDTLACAYFAAGDKAKAIEYIEKALKLQDEPEYRNRLEMFKK